MLSDEWIDWEGPEALNDELPWRRRLAKWPDEWREQWGLRANQLEGSGVDWIEAEKQAWNETLAEKAKPATLARPREQSTRTRELWKEAG